jgi:hypothetical protein
MYLSFFLCIPSRYVAKFLLKTISYGNTRCIKISLFNSLHVHRSENEDIHADELGFREGMVVALFTI